MHLLPCPFCGGTKNEIIEEVSDSDDAYCGYGLAVYCECGVQGAVGFTDSEASALWNTRNPTKQKVFVLSAYYDREIIAVFDSRQKAEEARLRLIQKYYPNEIYENVKYKYEINQFKIGSIPLNKFFS